MPQHTSLDPGAVDTRNRREGISLPECSDLFSPGDQRWSHLATAATPTITAGLSSRFSPFAGARAVLGIPLVCLLWVGALSGNAPQAKAQPLDPEQCAVRLPYSQIKPTVEQAARDAIEELASGSAATGDYNIDWIDLADVNLQRDGGRLKLSANVVFYTVALNAPFAMVRINMYFKWVESDVNQDWETCDTTMYPDFVVDAAHCIPVLDVTGYIFTGAFCTAVNTNTTVQRQFKCQAQNNLQEKLDEIIGESLFDIPVYFDPNSVGTGAPDLRVRYMLRHLIRDSGGVRLSSNYMYFLIPCIEGCATPRSGLDREGTSAHDAQGCIGNGFCIRLRHDDNIYDTVFDGFNAYFELNFRHEGVDIPRYIRDYLADRADRNLRTYGAEGSGSRSEHRIARKIALET